MREIHIGEQIVRVRATNLALLFYKQEFGRDIMGDLIKLDGIEADPSKFDSLLVMQLIWAMAKADAYGKGSFPSFISWFEGLDGLDLSDEEMYRAAFEEAANGFFRKRAKQPGR